MKDKISIFIADDHQIIIDGLTLLLNNTANFEVVGFASNGEAALQGIIKHKPQIAILDIKMPILSGLMVVKKLHEIRSSTRTVLLSMHKEDHLVSEAFLDGAYAFLFKNVNKVDLINTLEMVNKGMKVFSDFNPVPVDKTDSDKTFFSPREKQVLGMIIDGYSTKEISMHLSLSTFTVDSHRKSINRKTNSTSKTQLIAWAKEHNFYMT